MEKQAAERESERDEFSKKIESYETKIRDIDKERLKFDNISKEVCVHTNHATRPIASRHSVLGDDHSCQSYPLVDKNLVQPTDSKWHILARTVLPHNN